MMARASSVGSRNQIVVFVSELKLNNDDQSVSIDEPGRGLIRNDLVIQTYSWNIP